MAEKSKRGDTRLSGLVLGKPAWRKRNQHGGRISSQQTQLPDGLVRYLKGERKKARRQRGKGIGLGSLLQEAVEAGVKLGRSPQYSCMGAIGATGHFGSIKRVSFVHFDKLFQSPSLKCNPLIQHL